MYCLQHFQRMNTQTLILPKPLRLIRNINAVISAYFCTTPWSSAGFNNYYSDSLERKANQLNERIHIFSTDNCLKTTIFTWQREAHSESFKGWQVKKRSLKQKHLITIISSLLVVRSTLLVLLLKWHSPPRLPQGASSYPVKGIFYSIC